MRTQSKKKKKKKKKYLIGSNLRQAGKKCFVAQLVSPSKKGKKKAKIDGGHQSLGSTDLRARPVIGGSCAAASNNCVVCV